MDDKSRCQSCGMPLGTGFYGTNADGTVSDEYCKYCFEKGFFREPNLTLDDIIGRSIAQIIDEQNMSKDDAEELARKIIPNLKRWQTKAD